MGVMGSNPTVVGFMTHTQSQRQVFGNGAGGGVITWSHQFSLRRFFFHLHGETVYFLNIQESSALVPPLDHCPSAHDSPSAANIGGLEGLQRTQCHLTPRLIYAFTLHAARRKPLLQPMPGAHILTHRILKIEGDIWYEVGVRNLSILILYCAK